MKKTVNRSTLDECHYAIATFIENHTKDVLTKSDSYTIALSGGRTPVGLFKVLSNDRYRHSIEWAKVRFFWSDERFVPPTDPASNFLMAFDSLLSHLPVPENHIFRAPTEAKNCAEAAVQYQQIISDYFSAQDADCSEYIKADRYPRFDLILLGMGADGHTASLFPGHPALQDANLIAAVESEFANPPVPRLTFTLPLINSADTVVFMVNGKDKIKVLESFIGSNVKNCLIPASMVAPQNQLIWYIA
nr:6-phosphogluconolactonase [Desulfobulbaceae bacterium]